MFTFSFFKCIYTVYMHLFTNTQMATFSHICASTHISHTTQGTALNPNQTAMSHTVTVATVASSMQKHILSYHWWIFFLMRHTDVQPPFGDSNSCSDLSSASMNNALTCAALTAGGQRSDCDHSHPQKTFSSSSISNWKTAFVWPTRDLICLDSGERRCRLSREGSEPHRRVSPPGGVSITVEGRKGGALWSGLLYPSS